MASIFSVSDLEGEEGIFVLGDIEFNGVWRQLKETRESEYYEERIWVFDFEPNIISSDSHLSKVLASFSNSKILNISHFDSGDLKVDQHHMNVLSFTSFKKGEYVPTRNPDPLIKGQCSVILW